MKPLKEYIEKSIVNEWYEQQLNRSLMIGDKQIDKSVSEDDLKDAGFASSFMDDRSWIVINNNTYEKIKKDGWQGSNSNAHVLSGVITSNELFKLMEKYPTSLDHWRGELYIDGKTKVNL